jgi:cell division transport system permease protein
VDYYFRRAFEGIKASPAASGVALASLTASVLFAGAVLLVTSNAYRGVARWAASGIDVSVYFRPDAGEADVVATKTRIQDATGVVDLHYISQEDAWQFLAQSMDKSAELLAGLAPQVLPASIEIRLDRSLSDAYVDALVVGWKALPGVSDIQSSRATVVTGATAADIVRWVGWALGVPAGSLYAARRDERAAPRRRGRPRLLGARRPSRLA